MKSIYLPLIAIFFVVLSCNSNTAQKSIVKAEVTQEQLEKYETAYFASGCFWCVEAIFESVQGVQEVVSGYAGGKAETANYQLVSAGRTDHAEAVKVYYDPTIVSYETLVKVFFGSHDPTTLNRQGPDAGRQYRSAIFYKNDNEKKIVDTYIAQLKKDNVFSGTITTEVTKYTAFYDAEDYHQDYEARNPNNPYIKGVSIPRLKRFQKKFPELLKKNAH
ncbi:peptide methionine sulfoxide reductase MsrA 1 [Kordia sp. SMS9]|uniref:peptide-methionine (S)-S-oxide reductase MsrA n=1 Tax=Kordia sp. SMS9 TaxID=2282170 RepID=UPI000E0D8B1E|nr:peptide-methionine (S)-S-oxide reductase MsrA [Kordia sp. SMS9]AXG71375.1 peptide methionine sulfoxide reductase MsrA 1 [Kordia sp. SMS9]